MKTLFVVLGLSLLLSGAYAQAPNVQVNRENRTIAVTAEDSVEVAAEIAVLDFGYHNFAPTKEAAYDENVRMADQILTALFQAGVDKEDIHTERLSLRRVESVAYPSDKPKSIAFEARQSWKIRVGVLRAQVLLDAAIRAGANDVDDTEWVVADPRALQAKASARALEKARQVAEQMAKGLNTKLGELLYAGNQMPPRGYYSVNGMRMNETNASTTTISKEVELKLYPEKVKSEATVYAVFAIE